MTGLLRRLGRRSAYALALLVFVAVVAGVTRATGSWDRLRQSAGLGSQQPNVVLIVADDMRLDGLQFMPTMSALAQRGMTFRQGTVTTPLCGPSRASILTGLYAHNHNVRHNAPPLGGIELFDDQHTVATWVQARGVRTGLVGRYLNGYASTDVPPGWSSWFAIHQSDEQHSNYFRYLVTDQGERRYFGTKPEEYSTRVIAAEAKEFLAQEQSRPFFLLLAPRAPHGPATPDPEDAGVMKDRELPLPPSYNEADVSDKPGWIRENGLLGETKRERVELLRRRQIETLLGLDRAIADVVRTLEADGRANDTWIIFTSDNGLTLGEHRLDDGKLCPYEECTTTPLVVVPPGGWSEPKVSDAIVANIDLAPTIAEIFGATPTIPVDGRSFLPLLADPNAPWRDAVLLEQWTELVDKQFVGIRTVDKKYILYENGDEELYDLAADPYELESRHGDGPFKEVKARLAARLGELQAEHRRSGGDGR